MRGEVVGVPVKGDEWMKGDEALSRHGVRYY